MTRLRGKYFRTLTDKSVDCQMRARPWTACHSPNCSGFFRIWLRDIELMPGFILVRCHVKTREKHQIQVPCSTPRVVEPDAKAHFDCLSCNLGSIHHTPCLATCGLSPWSMCSVRDMQLSRVFYLSSNMSEAMRTTRYVVRITWSL